MAIHIKKSKQGSLHKALGIPKGEKIPASKLQDKPGDSPAMKKKKLFARNARKWNKGQDGISLPSNEEWADREMYNNFILDNEMIYPSAIEGYQNNPAYVNNPPQPLSSLPQQQVPRRYNGEVGDMALAGLLAVDALIPNRRQPSQVVRPLTAYNPNPFGNGSTALAQNGLAIGPKFRRNTSPLSYQEQQDLVSNQSIELMNDPNRRARSQNSYLNSQQQFFYNALSNPSTDLTDIYKGFNEELAGEISQIDQSITPGRSAFMGTYTLSNEDKALLQDEYITYSKKFGGNKVNYFNDLRNRGANNQRINNLIPAASMALGQQYKNGGKISSMGYKSTSPDRWQPTLRIPSNQITMEDVPHPVYGVDNTGYGQIMYPEENYSFPGIYVDEIPLARKGKRMCKNGGKLDGLEVGKSYQMSDEQIKFLVAQGYELNIQE